MVRKRQLTRSRPHRKKKSKPFDQYTGRQIAIVCVSLGMILGLLFWLKVTRCDNVDCIFHYFPLPEIFLGGFIGLIVAVGYWDDKF
jgi:hypothetical protein